MKYRTEHPSRYIDPAHAAIITSTAADAEVLKDLHPDQLKLIYESGWFKMFIPLKYGGLGWDLPRVLRMEEALSWADGSVGWVVTLCSGAGWFAGFLQPSLLERIVRGEKVCVAGSGAPTGKAEMKEGLYEITGTWQYASGSLHATAFTANCVIHRDGAPQHHQDGSPMIAAFVFLKEEVRVLRNWTSMGMIATASHSFEVKELQVPEARLFFIDPAHAVLKDPIYQYPFLQLAESTLSVNLSGMAVRFLDLSGPILSGSAKHRKEGTANGYALLTASSAQINRCRDKLYDAVARTWECCVEGEALQPRDLNLVSKASLDLAHTAVKVVDDLYPYCGLIAADMTQEINRVWRNIHTARQHALFRR